MPLTESYETGFLLCGLANAIESTFARCWVTAVSPSSLYTLWCAWTISTPRSPTPIFKKVHLSSSVIKALLRYVYVIDVNFYVFGFKKRIPLGHCWELQMCVSVFNPLQFLLSLTVVLQSRVRISFPPPQEAVHGLKVLHFIQCGSV